MTQRKRAFRYTREDLLSIETMDSEGPTPIRVDDMARAERITDMQVSFESLQTLEVKGHGKA